MSTQDYRIENGLVVNGPITADNVPGALSDLTDVDLSGEQQDGDSLVWNESANKWMPGAVDAGASAWIYVEETGPPDPMPSLVYTQSRVGIGTNGDQSLNYDFVVNGDTLLSDVKISGTSLIGNGTYSDLGDIRLVPNESLVAQGQYVYIRPTANLDQTHIHIEAGNVNTADLYLGDDDRYVKIDHTGPVKIGVPGASTTSNWTADSDATGTTYISIALATYPWAIDLTIGDTVTLPDESSVTISNAYFDIDYAYVNVDSPITYATSDVLEFTYQPRSEWSFKPDSSAEFPGDLTATSFIGDGSELTGIALAGLADVDTTTLPPSTGQGLLWDGLTSKWRPGNVPTGDPGPQGEIGFAGFKYDTRRVGANQYVIGEIIEYGGQYFICLANNDAIVPTGAAIGVYWSAYSFVGPAGSDGDHYHTTSTSTLTIAANGTISLTTVDLGLDYSVGQTVIIAHDINNHMHGDVVTYDPVTGVLTVLLKQKNGSGTYSSWSVNLSGPASSFPVIGSIDELNDVDTTTTAPTNGQALVWDATATQWKPGTVSGGGSLSSTVLSYTTSLLASGASTDLTVPGGNVFNLLAITSSSPVWVRVYGTTAARSADTRTQPGGIPPGSGNDYYAELVTVATPQTIRFSPVPVVQGTTGNAYVRVKNVDSSAQTITIDFTILTLES
jgi:hypothetical protein